jgi:hypothetical protein
VGAFAKQCAAVVALQYLLVLVDKTTVIAPGFTLLGHWGKVLACAIVTVCQFFFLLFFIVVVHSTLSFQTLNILGAMKIIKINKWPPCIFLVCRLWSAQTLVILVSKNPKKAIK